MNVGAVAIGAERRNHIQWEPEFLSMALMEMNDTSKFTAIYNLFLFLNELQ